MDRTFRGMIAGITAGIILNLYNFICFYLVKIVEIRFIDWSGILIFGGRPENTIEIIFALFHQLMWDGFLGIVFAYLIPKISSKGYLLKGVLYGYMLSFFFRSVAELFKLQFLASGKVPIETSLPNLIGVLLWGLILAIILQKLDEGFSKT